MTASAATATATATNADVAAVQSIRAVPAILEAVSEITGLRFVCVARVDADSWTACAVLDKLGFGLKAGDGLDVATTLCSEVRDSRAPIVIDNAPQDDRFCNHRTPRMYGFVSYISVPIFRRNGEYFGTLCGLDPLPAHLSAPRVLRTLELFCELISLQLDAEQAHAEREAELRSEQDTSMLREQFIAVLGHDMRTPLSAIMSGSELLARDLAGTPQASLVDCIRRSGERIRRLADDLLDFARGRMGGGMRMDMEAAPRLTEDLRQVVAELRLAHPGRRIEASLRLPPGIRCDRERLAQLLSNLLANALIYGTPQTPVKVTADWRDGLLSLSVHNHGNPIPPEVLPHLFEPFRGGGRQRRTDGLGLGLYIANQIALAHGGRIEVRSSEADGTLFRFAMPCPAAARQD